MFHEQQVKCEHPDAYIEPPCCEPGASGLVECGCGGRPELVCPNDECTGIDESEVNIIIERLAQ